MGRLLVVGSVAFDTVRTPFGEATEVLGGSATYFSTAASFFTDVDLIAVVGEDFPDEHVAFLKNRGIDLSGLERRSGKTFRWQGEYTYQLNEAHTLDTQLNVLESFRPKIPDHYRTPDHVVPGEHRPRASNGRTESGRTASNRRLRYHEFLDSWKTGSPLERVGKGRRARHQ